jgi:hypothetical protein
VFEGIVDKICLGNGTDREYIEGERGIRYRNWEERGPFLNIEWNY